MTLGDTDTDTGAGIAPAGTAGAPAAGSAQAQPFWSRPALRVIGGLAVPAVILAAWWLVTATGIVPTYRLPTPASVVTAAIQLGESGQLWLHIAISLQRVLLGFLFGSVAGLAVAAVVGLSRAGDVLFGPLLAALRAVPSLAWVPLLILWMQIGEESKVTLVAIGAFFPVFTTVALGLKHVDPLLVEAGRSFGYRGWDLFRTVQLPAAVPSLISGLRLGLAQAWLFLVAAELLGASMGLGWLLSTAQTTGRVDQILLAIILLALLGTATNALLQLAERRLLRRWA
ncbi:hypothetical protein GCM10027064_00450 [Microbacterium petrolearium]